MKVKALRNYFDIKAKVRRKRGDTFEVSEERYEEINSTSEGELVQKIDETPPINDNDNENEMDLLNGNVEETKNSITADLGKETLELLLSKEKEGKNRKGVIEHIQSLLEEGDE